MGVGRGKEECFVVATSAATHHARHFFPTNRIHKYMYVQYFECVVRGCECTSLTKRLKRRRVAGSCATTGCVCSGHVQGISSRAAVAG